LIENDRPFVRLGSLCFIVAEHIFLARSQRPSDQSDTVFTDEALTIAFSFLAPNTKSLVYCWVATAIGAVAVIFLVGPRLAMPTSSLAGQALTAGVLIGLLARCIWIATFSKDCDAG
jgi:hypothetical protein